MIVISSYVDRNARQCQEAGFDSFLSKPIQKHKLYRMLDKVMGENLDEEESERDKIITQYSIRDAMKNSVCILFAEDNPVN